MKLRGKKLGNVFLSSGSRNIDGGGWKQDIFFKWHPGYDFSGATTILKTITVDERMPNNSNKGTGKGNMVITNYTLQPKDWFPDCIKIDFIRDRMANSVGLSNSGARAFFSETIRRIKRKVVLSVMCIRSSSKSRVDEAREFVDIAGPKMNGCKFILALQDNESCPNAGRHSPRLGEIFTRLEIFQELGLPIIIKIDSLVTINFIQELEKSRLCDAIEIPNALSIYARQGKVNWHKLEYLVGPIFRRYGTCGYSGRENFEIAVEIIRDARKAGITLPIICGGVSSIEDIHIAKDAGANAISLGRATKTRFWKVKDLIQEGNRVFGGGEK